MRPLAITSIGRDGEDEDVVSGRAKPRIYVYAGTLLATAENAMRRADALLDVLALSGVRTAFGEIVICRAISDGYIELAGPSSASDLLQIAKLLREIAPPDCLYIIDGALSRRSQAGGGGITQNIILATSGETSAIPSELAEHLAHSLELLSLPELNREQKAMLNEAIEQLPNARVISLADQNGQTLIQKLVLPTLLGGHSSEIAELISDNTQHLFCAAPLPMKLSMNS